MGRVPGGVPGKRALLGDCWEQCWEAALECQQSPHAAVPFFPGTLPSTLPGTFGDLGFLSPVAGGLDSNTKQKRCEP